MPTARIEPTGIAIRKGKVQLRFSFYLKPNDPRYEEHHLRLPIIPEGGYPGEVNGEGIPVDMDDYNNWEESLPKEWQSNPFHNHFEYVDADITDESIAELLKQSLSEFFTIWSKGGDITKVWKAKGRFVSGDMSSQNIERCELKALDIANRASEFSQREL